MTNEQVVRDFFSCYQKHDFQGMHNCLHSDVKFSDFAFDIKGSDVFAMWEWFCTRKNPETGEKSVEVLSFKDVKAGEENDVVTATYEITYLFSDTKRIVRYFIDSRFEFRNGKIVKHHDDGSIKTWSKQAFGPPISWLYWTPFFKKRVHKTAAEKLCAFINSKQ